MRGVDGMSSENVRFLINEIVRRYAKVYVEAGIYRGGSLLSAALYNEVMCIGFDNFSGFNDDGANHQKLNKNLSSLKDHYKNSQIIIHEVDYRRIPEFVRDLKVDVYYYDAAHEYEHQLRGLELMLPFLSERCFLLVDDINWSRVNEATEEFLERHVGFETLFKVFTEDNAQPTWWNGFQVIGRNIE
jgi:cephalosporin hydroxylase